MNPNKPTDPVGELCRIMLEFKNEKIGLVDSDNYEYNVIGRNGQIKLTCDYVSKD
ncbi:MAG: hypothetical protein SH817_08710 [Leptospira sp.]|nr:hypothetical protein [Leptospira sp.]